MVSMLRRDIIYHVRRVLLMRGFKLYTCKTSSALRLRYNLGVLQCHVLNTSVHTATGHRRLAVIFPLPAHTPWPC